MESVPPDAFLEAYPEPIHAAADRLRALVLRAVPDAVERVRLGWRLIGYEVPSGPRTRYFAYVAPEFAHVHLGFEYGAWMADPGHLLRGSHLHLRKVRFLTFTPGDPIPRGPVIELTREAATVALMPPMERIARILG